MRLIEALEILQRPTVEEPAPFAVSLVCGFEPLHLRTFLVARLRQALPVAAVDVSTGIFDDLPGGLRRAADPATDAIAIVVEWADVDPRLGLRRLGGWKAADVADIGEQAELYLEHLARELISAADYAPVVCCPPTLHLPPLFGQRPEQSGAAELVLRSAAAGFAARLARDDRIRVCSLQELDQRSPMPGRRDLKTELTTGFPYSLNHADAVAQLLATLISPPAPKKGLITDLDDTLWAGVAGELGPSNVCWSLDSGSGPHAIYQQFLASLADSGVLIAAASRNDPGVVAEVFQRPDLVLPKEAIFPFELGWGAKTGSIQRILDAWNIGPDAVVFVDDSEIELDEARSAFPDLTTVRFPCEPDGDTELLTFLQGLRALFGKGTQTCEDRLRLESIRSAGEYRRAQAAPDFDADVFLARARGAIDFSRDGARRVRALELINKTNQFNLNGRRLTDAAFTRALDGGAAELITASYDDRYGPLGVVAALLVRPGSSPLQIDAWVMSCRAFSRRIEHHCLRYLFDAFGVDQVALEYQPTDRNEPLRMFLSALLGGPPCGTVRLTRDRFEERVPALVHRVSEAGT
jgi:FkbH-like protein